MLSDSTLTVLAIVAFVLIGLMFALTGLAVFSAARKEFRAFFRVNRVGSNLLIGSQFSSHVQIGDPTRIDDFIAELVKAGRVGEAVQVYRFTKDVGLEEATTAIERIGRDGPDAANASVPAPEPM